MTIRNLSLKELRVLAQQQLAGRAAELKTRQELVDALEAHEAKLARRAPKPAAAAVPPPAPPPIEKEPPPEPVIWTGHAPLPKITAAEGPVPVLSDFFIPPPPEVERYQDDRVLTFTRDPHTLYAAWDFAGAQFSTAEGSVVDVTGASIRSFAIGTALGGAFVGQLPGNVGLRVEVRRGEQLLGASSWVKLEGRAGTGGPGSSVVSPASSVV